MKIVLVSSLLLVSLQINSLFSQNNAVEKALNSFINDPVNVNASIGFLAYSLEDSLIIASNNQQTLLTPASITKLFSTSTAIEILGPYYRPKTRFYIDGEIDSTGVLNGNLWIRGGGDPTLGSRFFKNDDQKRFFLRQWCDSIKNNGIYQINGSIIADGSEFGYHGNPEGWTWGDMGNYYGSGPSGIVLFDNLTYLSLSSTTNVGDSTSIDCMDPWIENLTFRNEVKSNSVKGDESYAFGAPFSYDRFIMGSIPLNQEEFNVKVSIPDPEFLLAQELTYELMCNNVKVVGIPKGMRTSSLANDYSTFKSLYSINGNSIANIAYHTNMRSVNLFAEQLACIIGYYKTGKGTTDNGIYYINKYWQDKIGGGFYITDGSGLSRNNAVAAIHFVKLLESMYHSKNYTEFKKTLPIAGKSGTLRSVCRGQDASGRMMAKSGTMNRIKSYAGYMESSTGKKIAFAIIVNNHSCSSSEIVKKMEPIFNAMARY